MSDLPKYMAAVGEWARRELEANDFVWVGTCEADPRTPGPPVIGWARRRDDADLFVLTDDAPTWERLTEDEWRGRYPHARLPPRVPDDETEERP